MARIAQPLLTVAAYSVIIIVVFAFSGRSAEKTLYDRYLIKAEGEVLPVTDVKRALAFYHKVLDLPVDETPKKHQVPSVLLPGKQRLFMQQVPDTPDHFMPRPAAVVVRVRNGFERLHTDFLRRLAQPTREITKAHYWENMSPGSISQIFIGQWGRQFAVCDYDGNTLMFYRRAKLLLPESPAPDFSGKK